MKLKYYLRGLGLGVIFTTVILAISFGIHGKEISDEEIVSRAEKLGMEMKDNNALFPKDLLESEMNEPESEMQAEETMKQETPQSQDQESKDQETQGQESKDQNGTDSEKKDPDTTNQDPVSTGKDNSDPDGSNSETEKTQDSETKDDKSSDSGQDDAKKTTKKNVTLTVKSGEGCRQIAEKLLELGVIEDTEEFREYMSSRGLDGLIQSGEFSIPKNATHKEIAEILTNK